LGHASTKHKTLTSPLSTGAANKH